jgi:hypothetical protein
MTKLDSLKEVGSRIRWKSVLAVIFALLIVILVFRSIPSGYSVKDDIGLKAYADPDSIRMDDTTKLRIEVKNTGSDKEIEAVVVARAYDELLVFENTSSTVVEASLKVGPKETRRLTFEMKVLPGANEGTYRVDVSAKPVNKIEGVKEPVFINVEE